MKKMLILTRFVKEYEPTRLAEAGRDAGYEVDLVKYGQISVGVSDGKVEVDLRKGRKLEDYELVIMRAASKKGSSMVGTKTAILEILRRNGKAKVLNGESFDRYPLMGKTEQGLVLAKAGLPTVDFVSFGSKAGWEDFQEEPWFDFPMMVKGRFGSHGRAVKLVKDWDGFEEIMKEYKAGEVLVQPKLKIRQWYRAIVVNGEYLGEMRHRQKSKYEGEDGKMIKFSQQKMLRLKEVCVRACELFGVDYAGLDVAWDEDKQDWVVLEINRTAQFKYFEKRTGVNVAEKIVESMIKSF